MIGELKQYLNKIIDVNVPLEVASDDKFGDYATNVAFGLAKNQKKAPMILAQDLAFKIQETDVEKNFDKVEAVAPGFINFRVSGEYLVKNLGEVLGKKEIASPPAGGLAMTKKRVHLEFISANPTGPLTMANGRGGFLGDVLGNVLSSVGYEVTREYYVNDAGVQVKRLGESVLAALGLMPKLEEHYQGSYVEELAEKYKEEIIKKSKIKNQNEENITEEIGQLVAKDLLEKIKKSIQNVGINFDVWFSENENLRKKKMLDETLRILKERGMVYEEAGAVWLKNQKSLKHENTRTLKQEKDMLNDVHAMAGRENKDYVLVKSDGEPTYFLADISYHYNKFVTREFDAGIDIWGADHHGYVERLKNGLEAVGISKEKLEIILVQLVRLVRGGEEVKMSKRKGEFITLDELVGEVGVDAARFFFLMYSPNTHMDFDLDLAKERSSKNPVYYVQYAFVRCYAILQKAMPIGRQAQNEKRKMQNSTKITDYDFNTEDELRLLKQLVQLPDIVLQTAEDYQVNRLTRYATDLARAFHNFYEKERAITDNVKETEMRLALVEATKTIFEKLFKILGISAPEKM